MSIMELGALGEFLGFVGIMLTLGYLGYQTRQNSNGLRAANTFSILNATNSQNLMIAADERMLRLMIAGMNEPDSLEPEDLVAAQLAIRGYANVLQGAHSIRAGIPNDYWEVLVRANAQIAITPSSTTFIVSCR